MSELERELRELEPGWPATPDLAAAVGDRLAAPRRSFPAWRVGVAVAAAFLALAMAVPPARSAILEWLGLASVRIERAEPPRFGSELRLGRPVTLATARERADFDVVVPAALGAPDGVFLSPGPRVDLVYRPRLLVSEFRARATPLIEKTVGAGARVERLRVGGDPALFITGAEHGFMYVAPGGSGFEEQRLAGTTLLVERSDGVLLRIEGDLTRARAVRIAASAR